MFLDSTIYEAFKAAIEAQNDCHEGQGNCGRFNMFHVGLLSDIQAGNVNSETFAPYEFNRYGSETRGNAYELPILIMEPLLSSISSIDDLTDGNVNVAAKIVLYAGDTYQKGCCGVGNYCTERSKVQILLDLKMNVLAIIKEALRLLGETSFIGMNDNVNFMDDISFSFGNLGLGGVKAELSLYYASCVTDCGFTYPVEVTCEDDLGLSFVVEEIAPPDCGEGSTYQINKEYSPIYTHIDEDFTLVSVLHHNVEYFCPTPIPFTDIVAINEFLQSLAVNETLVAIADGDTVDMYLVSQCCAELIVTNTYIDGWGFTVNDGVDDVPFRYFVLYGSYPCNLVQETIPSFECCRKFQVTATATGTSDAIATDVIKWHVPENPNGVVGNTVETLHHVVFSRVITYNNGCPPKTVLYHIIGDDVPVITLIEELIWQQTPECSINITSITVEGEDELATFTISVDVNISTHYRLIVIDQFDNIDYTSDWQTTGDIVVALNDMIQLEPRRIVQAGDSEGNVCAEQEFIYDIATFPTSTTSIDLAAELDLADCISNQEYLILSNSTGSTVDIVGDTIELSTEPTMLSAIFLVQTCNGIYVGLYLIVFNS